MSYSHQKSDNVLIGAQMFDTPEMVTEAFGKKADLLRYKVIPVLLVVENNRKSTLDVRNIEVNIVSADGSHVSSLKPDDIQFLATNGKRPPQVPMNIPLPKRKKGLTAPEIASRAFAAEMIAPGDSASGFFYFEGTPEPGDKVYINGLHEVPSGREIMYFEFPLQP
jgi:hypothetical protein